MLPPRSHLVLELGLIILVILVPLTIALVVLWAKRRADRKAKKPEKELLGEEEDRGMGPM